MLAGDGFVSLKRVDVEFKVRQASSFRRRDTFAAVAGVDLSINERESVGLVGESGCGKSTLAGTLVGLVTPTAGTVTVDGIRVPVSDRGLRRQLRRTVQLVFQDPYASLHPRMKVWRNVAEAWRAHPGLVEQRHRRGEAERLLESVGLSAELGGRYPKQLSGGQRQRVAIARALAVEPRLLICDEPTSALDVSVQAQILNLLKGIASARDLSVLFISHDLAVVRQMADRVAVMYAGRIVEEGPSQKVYDHPAHPYTRLLLEASASLSTTHREEPVRMTEVAQAKGCPFQARCPYSREVCLEIRPELEVKDSGTRAACHFPI